MLEKPVTTIRERVRGPSYRRRRTELWVALYRQAFDGDAESGAEPNDEDVATRGR